MPGDDSRRRRAMRWALQSAARELLPDERVASCLRRVVPLRQWVDVLYSPKVKRAHYRGLRVCGSVWCCPVCAAKITERRRVELTQAVIGNSQFKTALVTLTLRHSQEDRLDVVLDALLSAYRFIKTGRQWQRFACDVGMVGSVRALEVTHGANGWHPHLHVLTFQTGSPGDLEGFFTERWLAALAREGQEALSGPGVDVRTADRDVADYVAKYGKEPVDTDRPFRWTMEHELTKAPVKQAGFGGASPSQLLADYACHNDKEAGNRWREYALAFKGKRQLVWSRGLRDLLGLGQEQSDEEIAKQHEQVAFVLAQMTLNQWRVVLANDARGELLEIAGSGDVGRVWLFLGAIGAGGQSVGAPVPYPWGVGSAGALW